MEATERSKKRVKGNEGIVLTSDSEPPQPARQEESTPVGLIWDFRDHSCGYDTTFTILNNLWPEDPNKWSAEFTYLGPIMGELAAALRSVVNGGKSLEQARNTVRRSMHTAEPEYFPYGPNTTSIDRIAEVLFPCKYYATGKQSCSECGYVDPCDYGLLESQMSVGLSSQQDCSNGVGLQSWMNTYLRKGRGACPVCRASGRHCRLDMNSTLRDVPPIILLNLDHESFIFNEKLSFVCEGVMVSLKLRGIIYAGQSHFTCRFIERGGKMWFHDGITTGRRCLPEINITANDSTEGADHFFFYFENFLKNYPLLTPFLTVRLVSMLQTTG
ncbi:hypothetical protein B0H16DRAFT_1346322 [Mycena metata]|uniref:Uncharacterized protein n=1 Tax=Mycena metata TaxID=1033252 RepID=A0AAD7M879_9AGAR|nr:hypothetical protein B0H16DRAFT_1346322 [Mycena metata]